MTGRRSVVTVVSVRCSWLRKVQWVPGTSGQYGLSIAWTKSAGSIAGRYASPGSRRAGSRSGETGGGLADETGDGAGLIGAALDGSVTAGERLSALETTGEGLGVVDPQPAAARAKTRIVIVETCSRRHDRSGTITDTSARGWIGFDRTRVRPPRRQPIERFRWWSGNWRITRSREAPPRRPGVAFGRGRRGHAPAFRRWTARDLPGGRDRRCCLGERDGGRRRGGPGRDPRDGHRRQPGDLARLPATLAARRARARHRDGGCDARRGDGRAGPRRARVGRDDLFRGRQRDRPFGVD